MKTLGITLREALETGWVGDEPILLHVPFRIGKVKEKVLYGRWVEDRILKHLKKEVERIEATGDGWEIWLAEKEEVIDEILKDPEGDLVGAGASGDHRRRDVQTGRPI